MVDLSTLAKAGVVMDTAGRIIGAAKQIDTLEALDNKIASKLKTKDEMIKEQILVMDDVGNVIRANFPSACGALDETMASFVVAAGKEVDAIVRSFKHTLSNPYCKVLAGQFYGSYIIYAGTKSYIKLGEDVFFWLTPESVRSVKFITKKFKPERMRKYYYYEIEFEDGNTCYVRVSRRHIANLMQCNKRMPEEKFHRDATPQK